MATTHSKLRDDPVSSHRRQIYDVSIGASDTAAIIPTGLNDVFYANWSNEDAEKNGKLVLNSDDGTEGTKQGSVYIDNLANSESLRLEVEGS